MLSLRLDLDVEPFGPPDSLDPLSVLFLPVFASSLDVSAARLVFRLADRFISGSSTVRGGLGGATGEGFLPDGVPLRLILFPRSVASGVCGDALVFVKLSLLVTASREWAFEKEGYGKLVFDADPVDETKEDARRSNSGIPDILRFELEWEREEVLRFWSRSTSRSGSFSFKEDDDLRDGFEER